MKRRNLLKGLGATTALSGFGAGIFDQAFASTGPDYTPSAATRALYERAMVIDTLAVGYEWDDVEFKALKDTGYTGIQTSLNNRNFSVALDQLNQWQHRIEDNPDKMHLVEKTDDFFTAKEKGVCGVMLGFQNGRVVEDDVDNLDILYRLGTRCIQLTYNHRNLIGNGCLERVDGGLSDFGVQVVERMNELGIIVDLSHCGVKTSYDGIEFSKGAPAAFTHTMCEALVPGHVRAKTDHQLKTMSDAGGMTGINMIGYFVGPNPGPGGETNIHTYVEHIDHAVNVCGIDHVGMCTDFQVRGISTWATYENWYEPRTRVYDDRYRLRWPSWIPELDEPQRFLYVAELLRKKGYSDDAVEKILGGNWIRYFREVIG